MWYADKFDQAWWQTLSMIGLGSTRMTHENLAVAAMEQHHQYARELRPGEVVTVRSVVVETNEVTILIRQEMTDDENGAMVAANAVRGVLLDAVTRKAQALPADVRQRATLFMTLNANTSDSHIIR
jgi:acyl-CoA thioester hydrolase